MTLNVSESGKRLIIATGYNMSANTTLEIEVTRPDDTGFTRTKPDVSIINAPLEGHAANTYMAYTFKVGDLTIKGEYFVHIKYADATPFSLSARTTFYVKP